MSYEETQEKIRKQDEEGMEVIKKQYIPRIISCFKEKPYVEGLDGVGTIFVEVIDDAPFHSFSVIEWLLQWILDWLFESTKSCPAEEKQMRINQSI